MRVFGSMRAHDGTVRQAERGDAVKKSAYKPKEDEEKLADIRRCLNCTKAVCSGCLSLHEGKYHEAARKRRREEAALT